MKKEEVISIVEVTWRINSIPVGDKSLFKSSVHSLISILFKICAIYKANDSEFPWKFIWSAPGKELNASK